MLWPRLTSFDHQNHALNSSNSNEKTDFPTILLLNQTKANFRGMEIAKFSLVLGCRQHISAPQPQYVHVQSTLSFLTLTATSKIKLSLTTLQHD